MDTGWRRDAENTRTDDISDVFLKANCRTSSHIAYLAPVMAGFEVPWVEKYRPQTLDEVVGNDRIVQQLKAISLQGNMPHLILVGPPGCGKTTTVMCLAREMLGDKTAEAVCELNASDDRGIDVVRERIKAFAQKKVTLPGNAHKLVILDEADSMTDSAQQALRMIMTDYTATTRFALACNDSSKVIEPIQSRCAILRFTRLADDMVLRRLTQVAEMEALQVEERAYEALIYTAEGDMRQALNNLQATAAGFGAITYEGVFQVCDQPHPELIRDILKYSLAGEFTQAADRLNLLWTKGYSPFDIAAALYKVASDVGVDEVKQLAVLKELAVLRMRLLDGVCSLLQFHGCLAKLCELS